MSRRFMSGVLASILLVGGCASTPYSVGAAPDRKGLAHFQSGRPTLISRAKSGVVQITPLASEFQDRIVLVVTAVNTGAAPVNFGYENIGAVYEDGGAAVLVPVQVLQREARERARVGSPAPAGAVSAINYGVDASAVIDSYGRPVKAESLDILRTTTIDPRRMTTGLIVLEKPWLNDRIRTLTLNVDLGGEGHAFRLAVARRGVLLPLGGVTAAMQFDVSELQPMPQVPLQASRQPPRPVVQASRKVQPSQPTRQVAKVSLPRQGAPQASSMAPRPRLDPYARPQIPRGVIE